jgi:hypothetical protein
MEIHRWPGLFVFRVLSVVFMLFALPMRGFHIKGREIRPKGVCSICLSFEDDTYKLLEEAVTSVLGPMANSLEACRIFTKAILDKQPWDRDPVCLRKPWDQDAYELRDHGKGHNICFAILWDNEIVRPHPPVIRAMTMVKRALEAVGHKGRPFVLLIFLR